MAVTIKPAGLNATALTANTLSLTASYLEQYRKPRNCKVQTPIQTTVTYAVGDTTFNGTSVFIPIVVTITAVYVLKNGTTRTRTFVELFDVAFQGQTEEPSSISVASLGRSTKTSTDCCAVTTLSIDDSLTVTIA